jgi:beta-1,4-N-acetylglucosaminyltransferase
VHGRLEALPQALLEAEKLREKGKQWPPVNSGAHRGYSGGLKGVLDEEMGFLD